MARLLTPNGPRIKELRTDALVELPQKRFAEQCNISERQLRRIENANLPTKVSILCRFAEILQVSVEEIAFSAGGPRIVSDVRGADPTLLTEEPKFIKYPRHTSTHLDTVAGAQALYELAERNMEIIHHIKVEAAPVQIAMIEECLSLLKTISRREWSCRVQGVQVESDHHDSTDFPEVSRRRRLAELFMLLKSHDIRIVANSEIYYYPEGATPWCDGEKTCFQLVIAFVPPLRVNEDETVTVPFDGGRDILLPSKPNF